MAAGLILMRRLLTILTAVALLVLSLAIGTVAADLPRSEEHTYELQPEPEI